VSGEWEWEWEWECGTQWLGPEWVGVQPRRDPGPAWLRVQALPHPVGARSLPVAASATWVTRCPLPAARCPRFTRH
jgi:hypothetical protein